MPRLDSEQRRRILDAAIPVFAEKGLDGASTRLVAKAAGYNSALIYYYFEDKETLFFEAVRTVVLGMLEQLRQNLRPFQSAEERIAHLINAVFDYYAAHPERIKLMAVTFPLHPDMLGRVLQNIGMQERLIPLEILRDGMAAGHLKPANPLQIWWSMLGTCIFTLFMNNVVMHVDQTRLPVKVPAPEEHRPYIISMYCEGLALHTSRTRPH